MILLSIRPHYAEKIFAETKTVELRRVCPKHIKKGDIVVIYVSSPVKSISGIFKVDKVIEKPLTELWKIVKHKAGVTYNEFRQYYKGLSAGTGIFFNEVKHLAYPVELNQLKAHIGKFQPPQNFRYITAEEMSYLQKIEFIDNIDLSKALD